MRRNTAENHLEPIEILNEVVKYTVDQDTRADDRIKERFDVLDILTEASINGEIRSLIVSGPPGLGKSYSVEKMLSDWDPSNEYYTIVRGYSRATGILRLLYQHQHERNVIVFDDADSVFDDPVGLNLLKCVCDSTEQRTVSWLSESKIIDETTGEILPRSFDFNGSIIFITNLDFASIADSNNKMAPHFEALMSRSFYVDLTLKSRRDYLIRIRQVIRSGMLNNLSGTEQLDVINYIEANYTKFRDLSIRTAIKLASLRQNTVNWEKIANVTMLR